MDFRGFHSTLDFRFEFPDFEFLISKLRGYDFLCNVILKREKRSVKLETSPQERNQEKCGYQFWPENEPLRIVNLDTK